MTALPLLFSTTSAATLKAILVYRQYT